MGDPILDTRLADTCGCGSSSNGGAAPASAAAVAATTGATPRFLAASVANTPAVATPSLTGNGGDFLALLRNIDWSRDWWKFVAGAVVGRILLGD